jgi:hypothetical protein
MNALGFAEANIIIHSHSVQQGFYCKQKKKHTRNFVMWFGIWGINMWLLLPVLKL